MYNGQAAAKEAQLRQANAAWVITDLAWYKTEASPGVYLWSAALDADYAVLKNMDVQIFIILMMAPAWARSDDRVCGRIAQEHISDFAEFARLAALRYPKVQYWLVWNEADSSYGEADCYGCWGEPSEPYYGGAYYASVFTPVQQAIKSVAPIDKVYAGGFMMPFPNDAQSEYLHGALLAGMNPDGIALHFYTWYSLGNTSPAPQVARIRSWTNAPIILTETSMLYSGSGEPYETAQADFVPYIYNEVGRLRLQGFAWYSLFDSGWNHSSLYEGERCKPACEAYRGLNE